MRAAACLRCEGRSAELVVSALVPDVVFHAGNVSFRAPPPASLKDKRSRWLPASTSRPQHQGEGDNPGEGLHQEDFPLIR